MPAKIAPVPHFTVDELAQKGKQARKRVPRSSHGEWSPDLRTDDPLELLDCQAVTRVPDLVPIRHGRMAASAFSFFRGAALVMASDLAAAPRSGMEVQLCGDAHLANFGGFASPERELVFDLNDFDETLSGPFEWDVKRLVASLEVAGRDRHFDEEERVDVVMTASKAYRDAIRQFAGMTNLDLWYTHLTITDLIARWGDQAGKATIRNLQRGAVKAESKDRLKAMAKLTEEVDGELRLKSNPPLLVPVSELFGGDEADRLHGTVRDALRAYRRTLSGDRRRLVESYRLVDLARKVVGVGSVGMRAWVALLVGRDSNDPLFIQVKEAEPSVLEPFLKKSPYKNNGQRVVEGQRLMQAASDIFLGWQRVDEGADGRPHDYYMRQLWDWKASADVESMAPPQLRMYAEICGWTLARAHAKSGERISIAEYVGTSETFDRAMVSFAQRYADQNEKDHAALVDAIASGRVQAMSGI
jgi:uncharacterized protein (DUF2252 family)